MSHIRTDGHARLLMPAWLGWIAGIALQLQQAALWRAPGYLVLVLTGLLALPALRRLRTPSWRVVWTLCALATLGFGTTGLRAVLFQQRALDPALEGRNIELTGRVSAMPQFGEDGTRFRFTVERAALDGKAVPVPAQLSLGWYRSADEDPGAATADGAAGPTTGHLQAGERWRLTARLRAPHGARNPHGFDYELWLWEQGLQATGYVRTGRHDPPPLRLGQSWHHPVEWTRQQVRDAIERRAGTPPAAADDEARAHALGIVAALVTGDQQAIARSDWDVFRATGVAHLMSISGLHITLFAWLAALLVRALWRTSTRLCLRYPAQHAGLLGGLLLAAGYAVFSGWGVPAQRTVLMLAIVTLLRLRGRSWPWPALWLMTAAVVLAVDPWAMVQAGFWLSFVAVGMLFAGAGRQASGGPRNWQQRIIGLLREQGLITLALAPLTLLLFGQVSLVGLLANLLAIPWVTLVVTPLALLGTLWAPLWDLAAHAVQWLGTVLELLATVPYATLTLPRAPLWAGLAGGLGGLLLVMRLPRPIRLSGLPLMLPLLLWQPVSPPMGQFELLAADIGQGNAVLVRTAHHALLYDAGPRYGDDNDAGGRVLVPLLHALGVRPDRVVLSHRDSDHTGGAASVLRAFPHADLLSSIESDHPLQALRHARRCEAGQHWDWDGVRFEILNPQATDYATVRSSNALSCVLRISNAQRVALLAGDIERAQEAALVGQQDVRLHADVLLVPHHGSRTSSSTAFLDAVAPRIALVQAGYRNRYRHPAADVIARYADRDVRVFTSPACGAAQWSSARPEAVSCERDVNAHYWQHRP